MATRDSEIALASDLFGGLGDIRIRRMFGGAGIYLGEAMFGLIAEGEIYLKTCPDTEADFRDAGSEPFRYTARNRAKPVELGYWKLPDEALDDPDAALAWGRRALDCARRACRKEKGRPGPAVEFP